MTTTNAAQTTSTNPPRPWDETPEAWATRARQVFATNLNIAREEFAAAYPSESDETRDARASRAAVEWTAAHMETDAAAVRKAVQS